ncbi:hypothetical protein Nit79A3_2267 [Nitrosomonas sp. Is79A3]|uniref:hypothetical protein n=1 Tax=Nitrosomonas sp. (strain Is79A3) TaxID=261292 RepID=UPI000215C781
MSIDPMQLSESLGTVALAVGGLGIASYGVVDGLKLFPWIDLAGFERLFSSRRTKGGRSWPMLQRAGLDPLLPALQAAYGKDALELMKAQYRSGRSKGDLQRTLRQGVRIGFGVMSQSEIFHAAYEIGIDEQAAEQATAALIAARNQRPPAAGETQVNAAEPVSAEQRSALARLETAIDARIDAALVLAEAQYVTQTKVIATIVALTIAFGVGHSLEANPLVSFMVGIAAVPLAPVAKDMATALQEAVRALKTR